MHLANHFIFLSYFLEEDTYGLLSIMASSRRAKYLFQSKLQLEVSSVTALELSKKHVVRNII